MFTKSLAVSFDNLTVNFIYENSNLIDIMLQYKLDTKRILVQSKKFK